MKDKEILIVGANGQLGIALSDKYKNAKTATIKELDITDTSSIRKYDWSGVKIIINAAAYTNVDAAETKDGRIDAWKVNAVGVKNLVKVCLEKDIILVHISTDYVFDGSKDSHSEDEPFSPLGVYGQSKAAGDILVSLLPKYYLIRTSWVIGEGRNFVRTMIQLGQKVTNPKVVYDQIGRLTFTSELVRGIDHLLTNQVVAGTYNISNEGPPASWAEIAEKIFKLYGLKNAVTYISTKEYFIDKPEAAPRPMFSILNLSKIKSIGFEPSDWYIDLKKYIKEGKINAL